MSRLVDFHIHIDYFEDYKRMYDFFNQNEVYALFVTNLPEIYGKCKNEFSPSKYVKIALGYNPQLVRKHKFNKEVFDKYFESTKYLGEVGLDYSKEFIEFQSEQREIFSYICKKAGEANKILSIHSRNAENDTLKILRACGVRFAIFHWYTGNLNLIDEILSCGYYFSVNYSMITSPKGKRIIGKIPLDRILIESDAPFGKCNKKANLPYNIKFIYDEVGRIMGVDDLPSIVFNNLKRLLVTNQKYTDS
jgi:TatD DNase family protein